MRGKWIIGGAFIAVICCAYVSVSANVMPGKFTWTRDPVMASAAPFHDADGVQKTLADFKGKTLVVNFWGTWCEPCEREMPALSKLQAKMGGDDFQVLAVSEDREGMAIAKPFLKKRRWDNLAIFTDPDGSFRRDAKVNDIPYTIIVNKAGYEVARVDGEADWWSGEMRIKLRQAKEK